MNFHKTGNIKTHDQLKDLIEEYKDFIAGTRIKPPRFVNEFNFLFSEDQSVKQYTWIDQTLKELESVEKKIQDEDNLLSHYQSPPGLQDWRTAKIKPISSQLFNQYIDDTVMKPDYYNLDPDQLVERKAKHQEILDFHNIAEYMPDEDLEALKPSPPSWI